MTNKIQQSASALFNLSVGGAPKHIIHHEFNVFPVFLRLVDFLCCMLNYFWFYSKSTVNSIQYP